MIDGKYCIFTYQYNHVTQGINVSKSIYLCIKSQKNTMKETVKSTATTATRPHTTRAAFPFISNIFEAFSGQISPQAPPKPPEPPNYLFPPSPSPVHATPPPPPL